MQKTLRIDLFLSFFLTTIIFTYILLSLQELDTLSLLIRYCFIVFIGYLTIVIIYFDKPNTNKILLFSPAFALTILYFVNLIGQAENTVILNSITQACFFMLVYVISAIKWKDYQVRLFSLFSIAAYLILISLIVTYTETGQYDHINPNSLGAYAFFLCFFPMLRIIDSKKRFKFLKFIAILSISLIAIYFSLSRSVYLSVLVGLFTFFAWKIITFRKVLFGLYFSIVGLIIFFITFFYPKMYTWNNYFQLNELSLKYTGKNIMSGRGQLWEKLLDIISLKPLVGHGAGVSLGTFLNTDLSPHNLYLQIAMQVGIVGIILFALFMFMLWMNFWKNRHDKRVIFSACFFIAIIFHQAFEVSLLQINFGIGLIQWTIIGFGLSFCFNTNKKPT